MMRRKEIVKALYSFCALDLVTEICDEDDSSSENLDASRGILSSPADDQDLLPLETLAYVETMRYLSPRINTVKSLAFLNQVLPSLGKREFKQDARMSPEALFRISELISGNRIF